MLHLFVSAFGTDTPQNSDGDRMRLSFRFMGRLGNTLVLAAHAYVFARAARARRPVFPSSV